MRFRIVGPGRAGGSFAAALTAVGWTLDATYRRGDDLGGAATGVPLVLLTVSDGAIASIAQAIEPGDAAVVHVAGSQTLDVLAPHERVGSVHPLMSLPDADTGARRLADHCHFAVAGDPITTEITEALGGVAFPVPDEHRALYHATAAIAANHLVALMAQVERLAGQVGVPVDAYWQLMRTTLDNAAATSPAEALTGPAARGDWDTVRRHLRTLEGRDRKLYLALAEDAARISGRELPEDFT